MLRRRWFAVVFCLGLAGPVLVAGVPWLDPVLLASVCQAFAKPIGKPGQNRQAKRRPDPVAEAGQKVFRARLCVGCHTVQSAGITSEEKLAGPDLSTVGRRYDARQLQAWIREGLPKSDGKQHPLLFLGSATEWQALVKWLTRLK